MGQVVDGKRLAREIRAELREEVAKLPEGPPCLAAVLVGQDPASAVYVRNKRRACEQTGIESRQLDLPAEIGEDRVLAEVERLNKDPGVHGILVQLPLPPDIRPARIAATIDPAKDVDGLHPVNVGRLLAGQPALYPCTPLGCLEILDRGGIELVGAQAVVLGRSEIVGKPVALMLLHRHATVTLCHSRTRDLAEHVRRAEVVIAAVGRPRMVRGDWIRAGAAVLDVGINRTEDGLVGDVDFEGASERAGLITPVPGGVGPLTITMLLRNTVRAFEAQIRPSPP
ncbi:MAG: bifunctional methylenetetrahydrofolate dehydrogenase/methenyltetrahydrofolate cyclohydrolase FolD [Myxococcota bacterium]